MNNLSAIQTLACEAMWRALQDRNTDKTGSGLTRDTPQPDARRKIAEFICSVPMVRLPKLILPEIAQNGVPSGYTRDWAQISEAGRRFDAHKLAQGNMRISQMSPLPEASNSSHTRTQSGSTGSETTPCAQTKARTNPFNDPPPAKKR